MKAFLIVGSAACVRKDLSAARRWNLPIIALNTQIRDLELPIAHGCTLHPEQAKPWHDGRDALAAQQGVPWTLWSGPEGDGMAWMDRCIDRNFAWHGTSALFAVDVALRMLRADRVVLAGCPIDKTAHYDGPHTLDDRDRLGWYREGWAKAFPTIRHKVRSLSGFTRELLTAPTSEWLRGDA